MAKENGHPVTRTELREELRAYPTRRELREDFQVLRSEIREELRTYPTRREFKEELKRFATQESLNRTQESVNRTQESVNRTQESVNRLARRVGDLTAEVATMKENMMTRDDFNRIMKVLDGLATSSNQTWAKLIVHEQRIKALEDR